MTPIRLMSLCGALSLTIAGAPRLLFAQNLPVHAGTRILRSGEFLVEVGDPESSECRWNRGLRFSPVANVLRLQLRGQEFVYSPATGGAVDSGYTGGLPMEFDIGQEAFQPDPPGYNEGVSGDPFLKIGVGILTRNSAAYSFSSTYPVVELARTTVRWETDRAHFVQTLAGAANGYSYALEEDLIVKNDRLIMKYLLKNTGNKTFTTEQYIHNFLAFNSKSVGPDYRISFPYDFTASPDVPVWSPPRSRLSAVTNNPAVVRFGNIIAYMSLISSVPKIWVYKPEGYLDADVFAVEQTGTGQRLIIDTSAPTPYVGIWTTDYQVSPEQFVMLTLSPGQEIAFTRTYTASVGGGLAEDSTADGLVDASDLFMLSSAWLSEPGGADWEPACDIAVPADDKIDLRDLSALAANWSRNAHSPRPTAYWRFDESVGGLALDEVSGKTGTLHGLSDEGSPWVAGKVEGGLLLDGLDDYVEIDDYPGVCGSAPRTVSLWMQTSERSASEMTLIAWGQPTPGGYWSLELDAGGRLRVSSNGGHAMVGPTVVGDARWHHVAAILDPVQAKAPLMSDVKLYIDGQRQNLYELVEHRIDTSCEGSIRIGGSHDPNDPSCFAGTIDDVRIFNTALSAENIEQIYEGG